jgi:probable HAF family extracellular repeat protein
MQDLGVLPGDNSSEAFGVNNSGEVVGYSYGSGGMRAFRWTKAGGMQSLGFLPGGKHSRALDISNTGEVIGTSTGPTGARAFIWTSKEGMKDLNLLIPVNLSLVLLEAHAVNERGQIIVLGTNARGGHDHEGANRLFLLTPAGAVKN